MANSATAGQEGKFKGFLVNQRFVGVGEEIPLVLRIFPRLFGLIRHLVGFCRADLQRIMSYVKGHEQEFIQTATECSEQAMKNLRRTATRKTGRFHQTW